MLYFADRRRPSVESKRKKKCWGEREKESARERRQAGGGGKWVRVGRMGGEVVARAVGKVDSLRKFRHPVGKATARLVCKRP